MLLVVFVLFGLAAIPASIALTGGEVVEECYEQGAPQPPIGNRVCRSTESVVNGAGRACRTTGQPECNSLDGRQIVPLASDHEDAWLPRALSLQRGLDDALPLSQEMWVHTHNSFNAEAYLPTLSGLDTNHIYSLTDQLRMGVRAIEIDVHWAPSAETAGPQDEGKAPIVCHGRTEGSGPARVHLGCTAEVHLLTRLQEVADWVDLNPGEVVMIYFQNELEGNGLAHLRAAEAIKTAFGEKVYTPNGTRGCETLPIDISRRQLVDWQKQILLVGDCDVSTGLWPSLVFHRDNRGVWDETSSPEGNDYPSYPACIESERIPKSYNTTWIRFYEDHTWLSAMVAGRRKATQVTPEDARNMARCGVNMPGFDNLYQFDERLVALVWSWAVDEPAAPGCAYSDEGFRSGDCKTPRRFACEDAEGGWVITKARGPWDKGSQHCERLGASYSVPKNGYQNSLLDDVRGSTAVWLDYRHDATAGTWVPEASGTTASRRGPDRLAFLHHG